MHVLTIDWFPFPADWNPQHWTRADQADPQKRLFIPFIAIAFIEDFYSSKEPSLLGLTSGPHWRTQMAALSKSEPTMRRWQGLNIPHKGWDVSILKYYKEVAYRDQIKKFKATLSGIGKENDFNIEWVKVKRFCNLLNDLFVCSEIIFA